MLRNSERQRSRAQETRTGTSLDGDVEHGVTRREGAQCAVADHGQNGFEPLEPSRLGVGQLLQLNTVDRRFKAASQSIIHTSASRIPMPTAAWSPRQKSNQVIS